MRSKKALALLLAASMVFTMNTSIFAGVKAASDDDGKVITQSDPDAEDPDTDSENKKDDDDPSGPDTPSGPNIPDTPNKTVTEDDIPDPDDKGTSTVDAKDSKNVDFSADALKKLIDNKDVKKVEVQLNGSTVTLPKSALESIFAQLEANGAVDFTINTRSFVPGNYYEEEVGIKSATQAYQISLEATSPYNRNNNHYYDDDEYYDEESVNVQDYEIDHLGKFSEAVGISFEASDDTKKLDKPNVYNLNPVTAVKTKEDVSDGSVDFETKDISSATFVVGAEAEAKGRVSANFVTTAYVEEDGILDSKTSVEFIDSSEIIADGDYKGYLLKTGNKDNGFKITAPIAVAPGYKFVKWVRTTYKYDGPYNTKTIIDESAENATIAAGGTVTFEPVISGTNWVDYFAVVTPLYTESTNVIKDVNGHKVEVTYNKTPAYTGKKLNGGNIVTEVLLDGKDVTDSAKFKIKGGKTVGSEVTVTIKSIKGLDKDTNKALKDKEIGTVKIRPIEVSEVTVLSKYFTQEGQIAVKLKGDAVKKVTVMVPNSLKFDKNKGTKRKVKKLSVKKGTYEYDSSTKYIKFDGSVLSGTVKVGIRSK